MLDSACAGHATAFLLDHELATLDELGSFFDISPLVDILATTLDDPPVLCDLFTQAVEQAHGDLLDDLWRHDRSEEHTSELQSLMRSSYAVFCLKKKTKK